MSPNKNRFQNLSSWRIFLLAFFNVVQFETLWIKFSGKILWILLKRRCSKSKRSSVLAWNLLFVSYLISLWFLFFNLTPKKFCWIQQLASHFYKPFSLVSNSFGRFSLALNTFWINWNPFSLLWIFRHITNLLKQHCWVFAWNICHKMWLWIIHTS